MEEPLAIPRALIERFLERFIPEAAEILSWMHTEDTGDGMSAALRQRLTNLKVAGWANLYLDPQNELKSKYLMLMRPEEINAIFAEVNAMSAEEQQAWLINMVEQAVDDDDDEEAPPLTIEIINAMPEEGRKTLIEDAQRFHMFFIPMLLNYLAVMAHRKTLYQLVSEAMNGNDDSFLRAIQADKSVLTTIPYFVERSRRAADEGDFKFQRQINTYRNKPIFVSRFRYPLLWLLLAILNEANLLSEFKKDKDALLDLCQRVGAYGPADDAADLASFEKRLREFEKDQQRLIPKPEQHIVVKPPTSSRSRP